MQWWQEILQKAEKFEKELFDANLEQKRRVELSKELAKINEHINLANQMKQLNNDLLAVQDLLQDCHDEELLKEKMKYIDQIEKLNTQWNELKMKKILSEESVIVEIRPGVGGAEASLFTNNLLNMYQSYSQSQKWKFDILYMHFTEVQGIREVAVNIKGVGAYEYLQHESGTHRIQRVPVTEASGRIHTSTATVAVLPEETDIEINIDEKYLDIAVCRSGGAGGQHVNTTDSAVKMTYFHPDLEKITVSMQDEKSQHKNREKAMKILRARAAEAIKNKEHQNRSENRKNQIGKGDRSERIRTYNFPQNRITDHRSKCSVYGLNENFLASASLLHELILSIDDI